LEFTVAWVEQGQVFAGVEAHEGTLITSLAMTEAELRAEVEKELVAQSHVKEARVHGSAQERAVALARLAHSPLPLERDAAIEALGEMDGPAIATLHELLADDAVYGDPVVHALVRASGRGAARTLVELVRRETAFFRAQKLEVGWWNGTGVEQARLEPLQNHYGRLVNALWLLRPMRYAAARAPVEELRDLWRSRPALEDRSGLSQMSEACEDLLEGLK
jgi:hypothetical protein